MVTQRSENVQCLNYGGGPRGHDPIHTMDPPLPPNLTFDCSSFIAIPSSWPPPPPDEGLPPPLAPQNKDGYATGDVDPW